MNSVAACCLVFLSLQRYCLVGMLLHLHFSNFFNFGALQPAFETGQLRLSGNSFVLCDCMPLYCAVVFVFKFCYSMSKWGYVQWTTNRCCFQWYFYKDLLCTLFSRSCNATRICRGIFLYLSLYLDGRKSLLFFVSNEHGSGIPKEIYELLQLLYPD